jgi:hypothetical protein
MKILEGIIKMKLLETPALLVEEIEVLSDTKEIMYTAGKHTWKPVQIAFEDIDELLQFVKNRYEAGKLMERGMLNSFPIDNFSFSGAKIDSIDIYNLTAIITCNHWRMKQ